MAGYSAILIAQVCAAAGMRTDGCGAVMAAGLEQVSCALPDTQSCWAQRQCSAAGT